MPPLRSGRSALFLRLACAATLSWILLIVLAAKTPPFIYSDQAFQLLAVKQHELGIASTPNHIVGPDAEDLSRDRETWIVWWPPGTALVTYPMIRTGLPIGSALRLAASAFVLLGAIGWSLWWARFEFHPWLLAIVAVALPWLRYSSNAIFQFSAEVLVFGAAPWLVLTGSAIAHRWNDRDHSAGLLPELGAGVLLGSVYWLKYSVALVSAGVWLFLVFEIVRLRRKALLSQLTALSIGMIVPVAALTALNMANASTANLVTASADLSFRWESLLHIIANPALMLADAGSMLYFALENPDRGLLPGSRLADTLAALPAGLTMLWLVFRWKATSAAGRLALVVFASSLALLFTIWTISSGASFEPRHLATACLTIGPVVALAGTARWSLARLPMRAWLLSLALVFMAVPPLIYSPLSVAIKIRRASGYETSQNAIYNPLLSRESLPTVVASLNDTYSEATDVWYIPEPLSALELRGRALVTHADFESREELASIQYRSSKPLRVLALLPPRFEDTGKGAIIRASFPQASEWSKRTFDGCEYSLWTSWLVPTAEP